MNFLILGCSWGVPNYSGLYGDPIDTHTEYILKAKGHNVINCAGNGASNLQSLDRANLYLAGKPIRHPAFPEVKTRLHLEDLDIKIDWVIWFQTAFLRDDKSVLPSETLIKDIAQLTYSGINRYLKNSNQKWHLLEVIQIYILVIKNILIQNLLSKVGDQQYLAKNRWNLILTIQNWNLNLSTMNYSYKI